MHSWYNNPLKKKKIDQKLTMFYIIQVNKENVSLRDKENLTKRILIGFNRVERWGQRSFLFLLFFFLDSSISIIIDIQFNWEKKKRHKINELKLTSFSFYFLLFLVFILLMKQKANELTKEKKEKSSFLLNYRLFKEKIF